MVLISAGQELTPRSPSMITVTDTITGRSVTVERYEVADAITPWYPDAPADVTTAIADLQDGITRGEYLGDLVEFLSIEVESV
jgi:hypothetical protein